MKPSEIESMTKALAPILNDFVEKKLAPIVKRLDELSGRPAFAYRGTWQAENTYEPGQFVSDKGCLWYVKHPSSARPSESHDSYQLAVKMGNGG
jgi:hypothetical protein